MGCLFSKPLIRCNAEGAADSLLAHLDVRKEKNIYKLLFSVIRNVQLDL